MFEKKRDVELSRYNGRGHYYVHDRTAMEVFHLKNDSTEFCGAFVFATPSEDSKGVAHILEHTVLSGSELFPVRDPFSRLAGTSPNTYLNAMTYTDKTVYPFASPLKKDFDNIFAVYADAVFSPLLRRESFEQEGIRFFDGYPDGVVFNEMHGDISTEDSLLENAAAAGLFAGTAAQYDSGGEPLEIMSLTYEEYLARYRKWYSPSNCRLFLYGDFDAGPCLERLENLYLNEKNLAKWENVKIVPSPDVYPVKRLKKTEVISVPCPSKTASSAVLTWRTGRADNPFDVMVMSVLVDLLLGAAGNPLYKAIVDSDIGEDLSPLSGMTSQSPYILFSAGFTGVKPGREAEVEKFLVRELEKLADRGFSEEEIEAAIRRQEFRLREIDGAGIPSGLRTALRVAKYWTRGVEPEKALFEDSNLNSIKEAVRNCSENGCFFGKYIRKNLLDNTDRVLCCSFHDSGYEDEYQAKLQKKYDCIVSATDKKVFEREKKNFRKFVGTPDSDKLLSVVPHICLADIPASFPLYNLNTEKIRDGNGFFTVAHAALFTRSVVYFNFAFRTDGLSDEQIRLLPLLLRLLQMCGAGKDDYVRTGNRLRLATGDFNIYHTAGTLPGGSFYSYAIVSVRCLQEYVGEALDVTGDILRSAGLTDLKRIEGSLSDIITCFEENYTENAASYASMYAASKFSKVKRITENICGTSAWLNLRRIREQKSTEELARDLVSLYDKVFVRTGAVFQICCEEKDMSRNLIALQQWIYTLKKAEHDNAAGFVSMADKPLSEADRSLAVRRCFLTLSSAPAFNARVVNLEGVPERNMVACMLFSSIVSNTRLWDEVRGQGGAYGVESHTNVQEKLLVFSSYRDPNIDRTFESFSGCFDTQLTDEDVENMKVVILGHELKPVTPEMFSYESMRRLLSGKSDELYEQRRKILLSLTRKDLEELARHLKSKTEIADVTICGADLLEQTGIESEVGEITELPL